MFIISNVGPLSSPGLVVGDAASGAGVFDDRRPLDDVGEECASCDSRGGGMIGVGAGCSLGCLDAAGTSASSTFAGSAGWTASEVAETSGFASSFFSGLLTPTVSSDGRVEACLDAECGRGDTGRLVGCTEPLLDGTCTDFGGDNELREIC